MFVYQLRVLDDDGDVGFKATFIHSNNSKALELARRLVAGEAQAEVWRAGRLVGMVAPIGDSRNSTAPTIH